MQVMKSLRLKIKMEQYIPLMLVKTRNEEKELYRYFQEGQGRARFLIRSEDVWRYQKSPVILPSFPLQFLYCCIYFNISYLRIIS